MVDRDVPNAQSQAVQAMLDFSLNMADNNKSYGRAWVLAAEVLNLIPSKLTDQLSSATAEALHVSLDTLYRMYLECLEKDGGRMDTPENRKYAREQFSKFQIERNSRLAEELGAVENFLYNRCFQIDESLCAEGWIRFKHHEGVDYTNLTEAAALPEQIKAREEELKGCLRDNDQLRKELDDIISLENDYQRVEKALQSIPSDFPAVAADVRDLAVQVHELSEICEDQINARIQQEQEVSPLREAILRQLS